MGNSTEDPIFDRHARNMLSLWADSYLPIRSPDSDEILYDIVGYLENLLGAFDQEPPAIYAGGPYSDRHGSAQNNFKEFLPLSRYQWLAWKLRLGGPDALKDEPGIFLSDASKKSYVGLRQAITEGLARAERLADSRFPKVTGVDDLLWEAGADFKTVFPGLIAEAAFSAPEYGGNLDAWKEIYYPGDAQPNGYAGQQISDADPGDDPYPMHTIAEVLLWFSTIIQHGRQFK